MGTRKPGMPNFYFLFKFQYYYREWRQFNSQLIVFDSCAFECNGFDLVGLVESVTVLQFGGSKDTAVH